MKIAGIDNGNGKGIRMETSCNSDRDAAITNEIKMGIPARIVAKKYGLNKDHVCRIVRQARSPKIVQPTDMAMHLDADSITPEQWKAQRLAKMQEAARKASK